MKTDFARAALFTELFASICEEMGVVLERASFSPNIKERRDYSCAVFDRAGSLLSQAAHIPVHLGAMEFLMKKWLAEGPPIEEGKYYVCNDPFFAGTHLPDVSCLAGVFQDGQCVGYCACRAHHADIGGSAPGSFAPVADVREEGIIIAPQEANDAAINRFANSCRGSIERRADYYAQIAAVRIGIVRFIELAEKYGAQLQEQMHNSFDYAHELTQTSLMSLRNGEYFAMDSMEYSDACDIHLKCSVINGSIRFDFSGTSPQVKFGINCTEAVTRSACYYVVKCLAPDAPVNAGCWRGAEVAAPSGSLVNAAFPAPVVAGNTETSQRIVDVILQALAHASDKIPACSQGTMNNIAFGGDDWAYYETLAGGAGGGPERAGASCIHTHMTNTRNTPVEAIELELPMRIRSYKVRRASGGPGEHGGGDGVVREYECLAPLECSIMSERRTSGPPGRRGGAGMPGRNSLLRAGEWRELPSKCRQVLRKGDVLRIETPGGGGWSL